MNFAELFLWEIFHFLNVGNKKVGFFFEKFSKKISCNWCSSIWFHEFFVDLVFLKEISGLLLKDPKNLRKCQTQKKRNEIRDEKTSVFILLWEESNTFKKLFKKLLYIHLYDSNWDFLACWKNKCRNIIWLFFPNRKDNYSTIAKFSKTSFNCIWFFSIKAIIVLLAAVVTILKIALQNVMSPPTFSNTTETMESTQEICWWRWPK